VLPSLGGVSAILEKLERRRCIRGPALAAVETTQNEMDAPVGVLGSGFEDLDRLRDSVEVRQRSGEMDARLASPGLSFKTIRKGGIAALDSHFVSKSLPAWCSLQGCMGPREGFLQERDRLIKLIESGFEAAVLEGTNPDPEGRV